MEYESITDFLFEGNSPDVLTEEQRYDFLLEYFEEEYLEDLNEEELGELYELVEGIVMKAISKNEFYNRVYGIVQEIAEAADEGFVKSKLAKRAAATSGAKRVSDVDKPGTKMTSNVKRIAKKGNKIVSKKVGAKTNVKTAAALQIGQRARRAKNRKAGKGLPPVSRNISRAEGELDRKKMAGPEG